MKPISLIILGLLSWSATCAIASEAMDIGVEVEGDLGSRYQILRDTGGNLSLEEIREKLSQGLFEPGIDDSINLGYTTDFIWLHFKLRNSSEGSVRRILEVDYPPLDDVRLIRLDLPDEVMISGDTIPMSKRASVSVEHRFYIELQPNQQVEYLLGVHTEVALNFRTATKLLFQTPQANCNRGMNAA